MINRERSGKPVLPTTEMEQKREKKGKEPSKPAEMFTNHKNPLDDKIMRKVQSDIAQTKKKIDNI